MIKIKHKGSFNNLERFLNYAKKINFYTKLSKYGEKGVAALSSATPTDSGKTANCWYYKIFNEKGTIKINWYNSNENDGVVIAIILQYGHLTNGSGYVAGKDYINPAIQPIFDEILENVWKEVCDA